LTDESDRSSPPAVPAGFHAFLLADVYIRDPGQGVYVDVRLQSGQYLRARASTEVLRLGLQLPSIWRATLHFRTDLDARLHEPLHLHRLRKFEYPLADDSNTFWSATGLVSRKRDAIVIFPERAKTQPFPISFQGGLDLGKATPGRSVRARGVVRDSVLVATYAEYIPDLPIPDRWGNGQPWLE
jgi:hypothetical protein